MSDKLIQWWRQQSDKEIESLLPKAKRYGALDLETIGFVLGAMTGKEPAEQTQQYRKELACYFYLLGKLGRMAGAYSAGELPDMDTLLDAGIYARMMQYIRTNGTWP
jgi:hypothetical protein